MKKYYAVLALFGIILTAVVLRFWQLGAVPVSPDWDEASIGYNANSILKTGRDEYGTRLPLSIRSFGDYKPPLYVYLTVPAIALFGLSVWSIRLPSAIMGVVAVIGVYFLVRELLEDKKGAFVAVISSFLLAISPWHVQFSRVAFEANIGVTLNIWAVTAFLYGLRRRIFLPVSAFLFVLGLYAYHSERVFLPLLVILLVSVYRRSLFKYENRNYILAAGFIAVIATLPLVPTLLNKAAIERLSGTSAINQQTSLLSRTVKKIEEDKRRGDTPGMVLDNRRIIWIKTVVAGYISHFSLKWLFVTGDYYRHHAPDMGLLYIWELPFLLFGIYVACKKIKGPARAVVIGWFLLSPVAASPTTELPHAVRTLVFLPTFQIFTALGICYGLAGLRESRGVKKAAYLAIASGVVCVALFNFIYYLDMYFVHLNPEYSQYWQYGYKELVDFAEKNKAKYKKVVVSTSLDQSYIFFLLYMNYDPKRYLAGGGTKPPSPDPVKNTFDKYVFRDLDLSKEKCDGTVLYAVSPLDISRGNVMEIKYLNGQPAVELTDTRCRIL